MIKFIFKSLSWVLDCLHDMMPFIIFVLACSSCVPR